MVKGVVILSNFKYNIKTNKFNKKGGRIIDYDKIHNQKIDISVYNNIYHLILNIYLDEAIAFHNAYWYR